MMGNPLISPEEVAKLLGVDVPTVRLWLKEPSCSFGHAVRCEKSWRYIIVRARFEAYMSAQDMKQV